MTEFEVINRVVDVDGTNKMIRGVWLTTIFFDYLFCIIRGWEYVTLDVMFYVDKRKIRNRCTYIYFFRIDLNLYK